MVPKLNSVRIALKKEDYHMKKVVGILMALFWLFVASAALADDAAVTHTINGRADLMERWVAPDAPTLVFFPGAGERGSAEDAWNKASKYVPVDWNLVCVAIYKNDGYEVEDWKLAIDGLMTVLDERRNQGKTTLEAIYVDGESNGGAGAFYFTNRILAGELGPQAKVKELTLLDGAIYYLVSSEAVKSLLTQTQVTLYVAAWSDLQTSLKGKELIKELRGYQNFYGHTLQCAHGNTLMEAYKSGLHGWA